MGRKAVPTQLNIVRGNPGKRPPPKKEAKVKLVCPRAPRELTAKAKKHWPVAAQRLARAKLLGETDIDALIAYCEAFATWQEAVHEIEKQGMVITPEKAIYEKPDGSTKTVYGTPVRNPAIAIMNKSFEQMTKLMSEFGMTPSSRTKAAVIGDPKEKDVDPWANA